MPALFDVPGWSVPSDPVCIQHQSKKRRRAANTEEQDLLHSAQLNLDKLIDSLGGGTGLGVDVGSGLSKKNRRRKPNKPTPQSSHCNRREEVHPLHSQPKPPVPLADQPTTSNNASLPRKKAKTRNAKHVAQPMNISEHSAAAQDTVGLTPLQRSLKKSLDGARFRVLNETLYKSSSLEAVRMMKEDPKIFDDYHVGFRRQVRSWPSNPVSYYTSKLSSSYPTKTVIADFGCGDAALARALLAKDFIVLSFDLVSDGAYVIEADICSRVPLPGSEPQSAESIQGDGQVVDIVVCALSLMGTNWPKCISEAWRILRPGGELMIAEVASRFASMDDFTSLITSIGFKLEQMDEHNTHFTLFQFKKVARPVISEREWRALMSRASVLKSCEYKRR